MVHIKESLLLIRKSSAFTNDSRLPLSLSEWSFTICPTPNLLSASLNKTFPSFLLHNLAVMEGHVDISLVFAYSGQNAGFQRFLQDI